ncbi:MAG: hemolysin XhlA family protein [Patescibacteria group bacterium]
MNIEILQRVTSIETKIDNYNGLREKLDKTCDLSEYNEKCIGQILESRKWLNRQIAGAFIASLLAVLISIIFRVLGV